MTPNFETNLTKLRETLLMMSSLTDRNLGLAMRALIQREEKLADTVEATDDEIDQLEISIDEQVIAFMATQAPVAKDCRFILVASKIGTNLERIADQAVGIARRSKDLSAQPILKPLIDIPRMATLATEMLRDAITAFVEEKPDLARDIVKRDKQIDEINRQLQREMTSFMLEDPSTITRAMNLSLVARNIERIADHAKNIAEEVYYLYRADDIRHSHQGKGDAVK